MEELKNIVADLRKINSASEANLSWLS